MTNKKDELYLIQEAVSFDNSGKITVQETEKDVYIQGTFIIADKPNGNNRIYPKRYLKTAIELYNREFIQPNKSIGELDHPIPPRPMPLIEKMAVFTEELTMNDNGVVFGKARVCKHSEHGIKLLNAIKDGLNFGTSFRALANVKKGADGYLYAGDTILFKAFDVVLVPSVQRDVDVVSEDIQYDNIWCVDGKCNVVKSAKSQLLEEDMTYSYVNDILVPNKKNININIDAFKSSL